METIIYAAVAAQVAQRSYRIVSSLYRSIPKASVPIVIEITTSEGKTAAKETIIPSAQRITPTVFFHSLVDEVSDFLHTIWLFTYSDVKTVLIPWALFGIGHALSASHFNLSIHPSTLRVFTRLPLIMAWIWLNLLPFAISNQRQPSAVQEDAINKPWRPLPSNRITPAGARTLMLTAYLAAFLFSLRHGGTSPTLALALLGYLYNDMGGADKSWAARHLLNGLGFISFGAGATEVALGSGFSYSPMLVQWLRIIACVVFTGIHAADMYDQQGDAEACRRTLPLVIGDEAARWALALSTIAWSIFCPIFWQVGPMGFVLPILGATVVVKRTLKDRSVEDDRKTYKLWNLWLVAIYCLPLAKVIGA